MTLPGQSISRVDGGLGLGTAAATARRCLLVGTCSSGTAKALTTWSNSALMRAALGEGPVIDAASWIIDNVGLQVDVLKTENSVAAANSAISKNGGSGPTITVAGSPLNLYDVQLTIVLGGSLGTATFHYSLDGGETVSDVISTPGGGTYAIPSTGLTLTFPSGTYVADDLYTFSCTPATYNATNVTDAWVTVLASNSKWALVVFTGRSASASAAATIHAAIISAMEDLEESYRYARALVDCGDDTDANVVSAQAAVSSAYLTRYYGDVRLELHAGYAGWGKPRLPFVYEQARRAALVAPGTNPAWVGLADDVLRRVYDPSYDEGSTGEVLYAVRVNAPTTYPGRWIGGHAAVYSTGALTAAAASSDYRHLQWCRVIDIFSDTVQIEQQTFINASPRCLADGSGNLDPRDAVRYNEQVTKALETAILKPKMDDGTTGYASAIQYGVDTTNDVLTDEEIVSTGKIVPRPNVSRVATTIGFATEI